MNVSLESRVEQYRSSNPWLCITLLWAEVQRLRAALAVKESRCQ